MYALENINKPVGAFSYQIKQVYNSEETIMAAAITHYYITYV